MQVQMQVDEHKCEGFDFVSLLVVAELCFFFFRARRLPILQGGAPG